MIWVGLLTILGALPLISGSCDEPVDPHNRRRYGLIINSPVLILSGKLPEGSKAYFECELGLGSRIIHHPSVCQANGEWTQTARCEVTCGPLRLGNFADLTYNTSLLHDDFFGSTGYSVNAMASFLCDELDPREGSSSVICQISGNWGQQAPICKNTCEEPDIPANGSLHSIFRSRYPNGKYPERTEVIFQYQTGNGTALLHSFCRNRNWTELMSLNAKCDYPPPPDPDNQQPFLFSLNYLDLVNGKYREGDKAYFKCELGIGNKIMYHPSVCQANGEWTQFRCEVICPRLNFINGEAAYNTSELHDDEYDRRGYSVGTMASFSCDGKESGSVICQSSGNWSQPGPTCIAIPCLYPTVDNGFFKILDFTKPFYNRIFFEDTLLEFHCNPGYTLENSLFPTLNRSVCQLNGTWFPPVPRCILKVSSDGIITYSKVKGFPENLHSITGTYRAITTFWNKTITLTQRHLIYGRKKYADKFEPEYAGQISIGDEVLLERNVELALQRSKMFLTT